MEKKRTELSKQSKKSKKGTFKKKDGEYIQMELLVRAEDKQNGKYLEEACKLLIKTNRNDFVECKTNCQMALIV